MIIPRKRYNSLVGNCIFPRTRYKVELDYTTTQLSCIYLVLYKDTLLGTFYRRNKSWIANPHYIDKKRIPSFLSQGLEGLFRSNHLAIKHIVDTYEGS